MRFRVYKDAGGYYRWTLWASNNKRVADSGEGYSNKSDCVSGIRIVTGLTSIDYFHFYTDTANQWRWRVKSTNGNIIADSAEGYSSKQACEDGAKLVLSTNGNTPIDS